MMIREPIVAGLFYPADRQTCSRALDDLLGEARQQPFSGGGRVIAGIAPHAGWRYSGHVAARTFAALAERAPDVVVMFGGVHRYRGHAAAMFPSGQWETPLGPLAVDGRLAERVLSHTSLIGEEPYAHDQEHSLEVQAPFVHYLFPDCRVLPIMVPPSAESEQVGQAVARTLLTYQYNALILGTTDLTHYGPQYGFVEHGVGESANVWAKEENDPHFIKLMCDVDAGHVVAEARERKNACSGGAVAATLAAAKKLGATRGHLLAHATSSEVCHQRGQGVPDDSVGYAAVVLTGDVN